MGRGEEVVGALGRECVGAGEAGRGCVGGARVRGSEGSKMMLRRKAPPSQLSLHRAGL